MQTISKFIFMMILCQNAFAGSYTVTLREFGFNRPNCTDDIAAVARTFAADAHAVILSSGCPAPGIGEAFSSAKFTYAATNPVEITTSDIRDAWRFDGYYSSVSSCESALQLERDLFTRLTGLQPFVGYCYKAKTVGAPRYRVRLDAVGTSTVKKYSISTSWAYKAANESELVSEVESMVRSVGGDIVAAMVDRDISGYLIAVDYYHEKEFYLHSQELLYWRSAELCQSSSDSLREQWNSKGGRSVFHCTKSTSGVSSLLQVYISDNILSGFDFNTEVYATEYPSESSCLSDISRIRIALEQSGTRVLGLTCGQEKTLKSWRLAVFTGRE